MNLLAHFFLSGSDPEIIAGNFLADYRKGHLHDALPPRVSEGILLHRLIDKFTDTHPLVEISKSRARTDFRKYAPVVVDIFYDHFLARNWSQYSNMPLRVFCKRMYNCLWDTRSYLTPQALTVLRHMSRQNWLFHYASIEGIGKSLAGIKRRTRHSEGLDFSTQHLLAHYSEYHDEFESYFPLLMLEGKQFHYQICNYDHSIIGSRLGHWKIHG